MALGEADCPKTRDLKIQKARSLPYLIYIFVLVERTGIATNPRFWANFNQLEILLRG